MLIGYLHYRKKPVGLNKAYAFASVAKAEGAELLYFSPGAVDFNDKSIGGYVYHDGEWVRTKSRYPDVVCNIAAFSRDKQCEAAERLRETVPFTSHSVGNKMIVFDNLTKYGRFADYLVPTEEVGTSEQFFELSQKYPELVLKPVSGHQGEGIYFINRNGGSFNITSGADAAQYGAEQALDFISAQLGREAYLAQPYINCRTKSGDPYDFRLHVQKDARGAWVASSIYPRISPDGGIICNISRGGHTEELVGFLKREFGGDYYDIEKYIEIFALQLAAHMDEIQREQYGEELSELGIDIGLDRERRIYIYEINWRPGYPPSNNVDLTVVRNMVRYAMFLARRQKNEDDSVHRHE